MTGHGLWYVVLIAAACYCLTRGALDLAQRRYFWSVAGLIIGGAILLMPLQSRAIKIDLSAAQP